MQLFWGGGGAWEQGYPALYNFYQGRAEPSKSTPFRIPWKNSEGVQILPFLSFKIHVYYNNNYYIIKIVLISQIYFSKLVYYPRKLQKLDPSKISCYTCIQYTLYLRTSPDYAQLQSLQLPHSVCECP